MSAPTLHHTKHLRATQVLVDRPTAQIGMTAQQHRGPNRTVGAPKESEERSVVKRGRWTRPQRHTAPLIRRQAAPYTKLTSSNRCSEARATHRTTGAHSLGPGDSAWRRVVEQRGAKPGARCGGPPTAASVVGHDG